MGAGLRLALKKMVASLRPEQDVIILIVEDVIALLCSHRQDGMTFALFVTYHGHEERLARPAGLYEDAPLKQDVVLAMSYSQILVTEGIRRQRLELAI